MAKAKAATPKKSKKSTTQKTATPVRRSPRLTKAPTDELAIIEDKIEGKVKVAKRTTAKKIATASKPSAKAAGKKTPTKSKTSKSPSPKKSGAPAVDPEPLPSPKRGRPKKDTKTTSIGRSRTPSQPRASSRGKSQTPEDEPYTPSPDADDADAAGQWTDSPKKRRAPNTVSKASSTATAGKKKSTGAGGVRKSVELPEINTKRRSSSPSRKASTSPVRGRSNTKTRQKSRGSSTGSKTSTAKGQSKSPARKPSAETKVSVNFTVDDAPTLSPKRGRSTSPRERTASRSQSPAKAQGGNDKAGKATSPGKKDRTRSQSPTKSTRRKANKISSEVSTLSTVEGSQGPRSRSRASSLGKELSPTRMDEPRASRSSAKKSPSKGRISRSASPKKSERAATSGRRLGDPSHGRRNARSTGPAKRLPKQTQSKRRPLDDDGFAERMAQQDVYGGFLRMIEKNAYRAYKGGVEPPEQSYTLITHDDKERAILEGHKRAELQMELNTKGAMPKAISQSRRASSTSRVQEIGSNDEKSKPGKSSDQTRRSPQRPRNSGTSQASPKRSASRSQSPSKSSSKKSNDGAKLLPDGKPSGDGRGAIHSVTNQQIIPGSNRENPFFETMPAPQVWHRRMPPFLPFDETPFMEREMSRQISEDLARGEDKTKSSWSSYLPPLPWRRSTPEQRPYVSPWTLPVPTEAQRKAVAKEVNRFIDSQANVGGTKRKASEQPLRGPVKRVRRRSRGEDVTMSGGL